MKSTERSVNLERKNINGTFENIIKRDGNILIGDNLFPVFGDVTILSISDPTPHYSGNLMYYDCGQVTYKKIS